MSEWTREDWKEFLSKVGQLFAVTIVFGGVAYEVGPITALALVGILLKVYNPPAA